MKSTKRRTFMLTLSAFGMSAAPQKVKIVDFDDAGNQKGVIEVDKVVKLEGEWKKELSPIEFEVTRKHGTERALQLLRDGADREPVRAV